MTGICVKRTLTIHLSVLVLFTLVSFRAHGDASGYHDFIYLSADSIASSGAESTLPESPKAFIFNPAALSKGFLPTISHSHSARHFPRELKEWPEMDQLDCDIESVIVPLLIGRLGYAFSLKDELGYDYTNHPPGALGFPREKLEGSENLIAYAIGGYPLSVGASLRRLSYRYFPDPKGLPRPRLDTGLSGDWRASWIKEGEWQGLGVLVGLPFLRGSYSKSRTDLHWINLPSGQKESLVINERRTGERFYPFAWLGLAREERRTLNRRGDAGLSVAAAEGNGESYFSLSLRPMSIVEISIGKWDGKRTVGFRFFLGPITLNYSEIKDFLNRIVAGSSRTMQDIHFYGFRLGLW